MKPPLCITKIVSYKSKITVMNYKLALLLFLSISNFAYSQTEYIERYNNGQIKIKAFITNSLLTGKYIEYYKNGSVKMIGAFNDCEYKTNHIKTDVTPFPVTINSKLFKGKKHGVWKYYYENGALEGTANFLCGQRQGKFYYYQKDGKTRWIDYYSADKEMGTHVFYESGQLSEITTHSYEYNEKKELELKLTIVTEYFEDGSLKVKRVTKESKNRIQITNYKKYYTNGFLKSEIEIVDFKANGVYRLFYENGIKKYEGYHKDDKPIGKHYSYDENGELERVETFKDGKVVSTELKKTSG